MADRVFGHIPGVAVGSIFPDRRSLSQTGVHRPTQAGISGNKTDGADSIVVSGGYRDDRDYGDLIIYTGQGGNDPNTKRQVTDQELVRGQLAQPRVQWPRRDRRKETMATANPNTCPHCGSSNSGANFGFNPQRINNDETLIHDVLFACADCDGEWAAIGYVMIAQRNGGERSKEAQKALAEAVAGAEELRIEPLDQQGNPT